MRLPLAWLQLSHERTRMIAAVLGVAFANILMFVQLGFHDALFDSATLVQQRMRGDLFIISRQSEAMFRMQPFSRRHLYRAMSHPEVEAVSPLYTSVAVWKNPWNGRRRSIFVMGMEINSPLLSLPGLAENLSLLRLKDVCLYDEHSRPEFGPVGEAMRRGETVDVEIDRRKLRVAGLFQLGASFSADGNVVTSDSNFLRMTPNRKPGAIDVGVIRIKDPGRVLAVQQDLSRALPNDLKIFTSIEFVLFERRYWEDSTAIGFIFAVGVAMGFLVGFVIVYQILYTDVASHLPQYATMKAMGYSDTYLLSVVMQESLILSILGYIPGLIVSWQLFRYAAAATFLPMMVKPERAILIFCLTLGMCFLSGALAMRKLRDADPADVFG